MKNLISKKLALLAMVLFASIGSAFGYEISFEFNYENVAGVRIYVDDGDESYYDGFAQKRSTVVAIPFSTMGITTPFALNSPKKPARPFM